MTSYCVCPLRGWTYVVIALTACGAGNVIQPARGGAETVVVGIALFAIALVRHAEEVNCAGHFKLADRRKTWPSAIDVEISGFDVVEGSVRIYVQSMFGEPGRGLSSGHCQVGVLPGRCQDRWS